MKPDISKYKIFIVTLPCGCKKANGVWFVCAGHWRFTGRPKGKPNEQGGKK